MCARIGSFEFSRAATCIQSLRLRKGIKLFGAFPEQEEVLGGSNTHS